jgi:hypothetical protein
MSKRVDHEKVNKLQNVERCILPEIKFSETGTGGFKIQVAGVVDTKKFLQMISTWLSKQQIEKVGWPTIFFTPK